MRKKMLKYQCGHSYNPLWNIVSQSKDIIHYKSPIIKEDLIKSTR